jgi:hypothetical protein
VKLCASYTAQWWQTVFVSEIANFFSLQNDIANHKKNDIKNFSSILLTFSLNLFAEDGSDIHYIEESKIDSNLVEKYIQIDFYKNSFGRKKIQ